MKRSSFKPAKEFVPDSIFGFVTLTIVMAIAFTAVGSTIIWVAYNQASPMLSSHTLDGRITGVTAENEPNGRRCISTVLYAVEGERYETRWSACPGIGTEVTVRFDPANPASSTVRTPASVYGGGVVFGTLFAAMGSAMIFTAGSLLYSAPAVVKRARGKEKSLGKRMAS